MRKKTEIPRRTFLKTAAAAPAFCIVPRYAIAGTKAPGPNDKLGLAVIGTSQRGGSIAQWCARDKSTHLVALCDVVPSRAEGVKAKYNKEAAVFDDFRKMFDKMADKIDACTNGTPDHAHFPICMLAMSLGKHVYVEKPLAHTFEECELLIKAEKKYKVACQMGNQGHSGNQRRQFQQWLERGIIKNVRKVDACMNKGRRWHPWGNVTGYPPKEPLPEGMNWEVWTGTAEMHDYSKKFDGGNWRGWHIYGDGAFGDWGPHTLDSIHRFLKLGLPFEVRADKLEGRNDFIYPMASTIAFEFAARGDMPPMTIFWYDGTKNKPPKPEGIDTKMPGCGKIIYCDDLVIKGTTHSGTHQIIGGARAKDISREEMKLTGTSETSTDHMVNFINAALGKEECNSKFAVSGPLCQMFALGCIAQRLGGTFKFDAKTGRITNNKRADELLRVPPRKGWEEFYKLS
jgi:predicted dehydrogenase